MESFNLTDGRVLEIDYDSFAENPRNWDNLSQMICFHSRYNVGDDHSYNHNDYNGWEEMEKAIIKEEDPAVILPMYMYEHSGIAISTTPFSCRWDSGQIGFILISKARARKDLNVKRITKGIVERLTNCLLGELKVYGQYIEGEVYSFTILDKDGEVEDSCSGFYGYDILNNGILDCISKSDAEEIKKQL